MLKWFAFSSPGLITNGDMETCQFFPVAILAVPALKKQMHACPWVMLSQVNEMEAQGSRA